MLAQTRGFAYTHTASYCELQVTLLCTQRFDFDFLPALHLQSSVLVHGFLCGRLNWVFSFSADAKIGNFIIIIIIIICGGSVGE